jgi:hypothetical protein
MIMKYNVAVGLLSWEERFWSSVMVLSRSYCSYVRYLDADVRQVRTYKQAISDPRFPQGSRCAQHLPDRRSV